MSTNQRNFATFIRQHNAALGILAAILAVSTASIFIRFAQQNLSSLVIATYRLLLAALVLLPFSIRGISQEYGQLRPSDWRLLIASGVLLALHFASWIASLRLTNVISSVVLVTTTPIWVTLLSPYLLKESLPRTFTLGLMIALLGIVLISLGSLCGLSADGWQCAPLSSLAQVENLKGNLLALAGAWCAAGYLMAGRRVRARLSNRSYVFLVYALAAVTLLALSLFTQQPMLSVSSRDLTWLILLALIPQVLGHSLLNWALGKLPAAFVSLSLLGEPVGSAVLAFFFLGEQPTVLEWLGSAVIIYGIFVAARPSKRPSEIMPAP